MGWLVGERRRLLLCSFLYSIFTVAYLEFQIIAIKKPRRFQRGFKSYVAFSVENLFQIIDRCSVFNRFVELRVQFLFCFADLIVRFSAVSNRVNQIVVLRC